MGQEDLLEKEMATHSSILAWEILWTREDWQATVHGITKSRTTIIKKKKNEAFNGHGYEFEILS